MEPINADKPLSSNPQDQILKAKSWWNAGLFQDYIKTLFLGIVIFGLGLFFRQAPSFLRIAFIIFGGILIVASFYAVKQRWNKI